VLPAVEEALDFKCIQAEGAYVKGNYPVIKVLMSVSTASMYTVLDHALYITSNSGIMDNELETMWKKRVMRQYKILFCHLLSGTE
jgi:hypothetical protein